MRFRVDLPEPIDIAGSLELFRRSGDDLIDRWDGRRLVRAAHVDGGRWMPFVAEARSGGFDVSVEAAAHAAPVRAVVAHTFLAAPPDYARLLAEDPILARLDALAPGIRQIRQLDVFTALIRCISAQQVNLRWAATTRRRLAEAFGRCYEVEGQRVCALDPERIARVDPVEIRALQFTTAKARSIVATAQAIAAGGLDLGDLEGLEDEAVIQRLVSIRGIGRWSAEWVLARTLGRPRVVAGDLGVRKAVGLTYLGTPTPGEAAVRAATAHWGASAGVAQALLLYAMAEGLITQGPAAHSREGPRVPRAPGARRRAPAGSPAAPRA